MKGIRIMRFVGNRPEPEATLYEGDEFDLSQDMQDLEELISRWHKFMINVLVHTAYELRRESYDRRHEQRRTEYLN